MKMAKVLIGIIAMTFCIECHAIRVTTDYGYGIKVFNGHGTTKLSLDNGNTWITIEEPKKNEVAERPKTDYLTPSLVSDAASSIANDDYYKFNNISCSNSVCVVKKGTVKKLDFKMKTGTKNINLDYDDRLLPYGAEDKSMKYVWISSAKKQHLMSLLEVYCKSSDYVCTMPLGVDDKYGIFEIKQPITVMQFKHMPAVGYCSLDKSKTFTLKQGVLVDTWTFKTLIDWLNKISSADKKQ